MRRVVRRVRRGDAGLTLIEVVVSMTIMVIFMSIFTAGMLQMTRTANRNEVIYRAQAQVNLVFLRLDRELRYASGISTPGPVGANSYVEYLTTNTGVQKCTQLRLVPARRQLQSRTWVQGQTPLQPTNWVPMASDVESDQPFRSYAPDDTHQFQRLRVDLRAVVGTGDRSVSKRTDVTFTALNSVRGGDSSTVCSEGRSVP